MRSFIVAVVVMISSFAIAEPTWTNVQRGVDYADIAVTPTDHFHVVRIDPKIAPLRAVFASRLDGKSRTAKAWCDEQKLAVAINLGMYRDDHLHNVGHAAADKHVNQATWVSAYNSALVWSPKSPDLPSAQMVELDEPGGRELAARYQNIVQNLRLIKAPGRNVWTAQPRQWSEAAVAMDKDKHILFVFARQRHSMVEFNRLLLAQPLGIVAAMHVEGGPEASLCVRSKKVSLDFNGSYETGFMENDNLNQQWEIPNLLAVGATP